MNLEASRVIDVLPGMVWTAVPDGSIDFVNQRWCEFTHLGARESYGQGWQSAIHAKDLPDFIERWRTIVASGEPGEWKARLRRREGPRHVTQPPQQVRERFAHRLVVIYDRDLWPWKYHALLETEKSTQASCKTDGEHSGQTASVSGGLSGLMSRGCATATGVASPLVAVSGASRVHVGEAESSLPSFNRLCASRLISWSRDFSSVRRLRRSDTPFRNGSHRVRTCESSRS
jgi:hypothetical protein